MKKKQYKYLADGVKEKLKDPYLLSVLYSVMTFKSRNHDPLFWRVWRSLGLDLSLYFPIYSEVCRNYVPDVFTPLFLGDTKWTIRIYGEEIAVPGKKPRRVFCINVIRSKKNLMPNWIWDGTSFTFYHPHGSVHVLFLKK
jgi:hypothetical protein